MYDFGFLSPCPAHGLVLQGDRDDIVSEPAVSNLVDKLRAQKGTKVDYKMIAGADHYYRNTMAEMQNNVDAYIATEMEAFRSRPRVKADKKRRNAIPQEFLDLLKQA